jgi:hypothetical protein
MKLPRWLLRSSRLVARLLVRRASFNKRRDDTFVSDTMAPSYCPPILVEWALRYLRGHPSSLSPPPSRLRYFTSLYTRFVDSPHALVF